MSDPWLQQFEARRLERDQADRSFTFLDETLTHKAAVAPEVGFRLGEFQRKQLAYQKAQEEKLLAGEEPDELGVSNEELLDLCEWTIRSCLEPGSVEAWERIRDPAYPNPMSLLEIYGFATYIQARASGVFPTGEPTGSSDGQSNGGRSSKAASRSPAAPSPRRSKAS